MRSVVPLLSGFVLAGGASQRMGQPKALLRLAGETMLERQVRLLNAACRSVAVVGLVGQLEGLDAPMLHDEFPGRGPLAALYTGLRWTRTEFNLFVACDLPFLNLRFLRYLCGRALSRGADVTVPESRQHGFHPLCAVYRRRALWAVRSSLATGHNKVTRFFRRVHCEIVSERELRRAGFGLQIFANMNTFADYENAVRILGLHSVSRERVRVDQDNV